MGVWKSIIKEVFAVNPKKVVIDGVSLIVNGSKSSGEEVDVFDKETSLETNDDVAVKTLLIEARPSAKCSDRCPICHSKGKIYDRAGHTKAWRSLDIHNIRTFIIGPNHRIVCPKHGPITVDVPWAEQNSGFTIAFEHDVTFCAKNMTKKDVTQLFGIDYETTGRIVKRTLARVEPDPLKRLEGLTAIGFDETSFKHGGKFITVAMDHVRGRVIWVGKGKGNAVMDEFCSLLTPEQREAIVAVTGDGADWVTYAVEKYFPNAKRCDDSFHVVQWATDAMDEVRRAVVNESKRAVEKLKREVSAEAKKDALQNIKAEIDKEISSVKERICETKAIEQALREEQKTIRSLQQDYRNELPCLEQRSREYQQYAQELYDISCSPLLSAEQQCHFIFDALTLAYGYLDMKDCIRESRLYLKTSVVRLKEIRDEIKEAGITRRSLMSDLKAVRKKGKERLAEARKREYRYDSEGIVDMSEEAQKHFEKLSEAEEKAATLKRSRYAFLHNPEDLTSNQRTKLKLLTEADPDLQLAYRLKERLRLVFHSEDIDMVSAELDLWIEDAKNSRLEPFKNLSDTILKHKPFILNTLELGLNNARIEAINNKIKIVIRRSYGFRNVENLIAMIMYVCSDIEVARCNKPSVAKRVACIHWEQVRRFSA